jgi:acyl carrier protein phosphodiesterase
MNFLAHAWLSFNDPDILAGNMVSDFVKGRKQFDLPESVQKGIQLHRAIDKFTDEHAVTKQVKELFRPYYRLYSGAIVDVVHDYFLANDKNQFETFAALDAFAQNAYSQIDEQIDILPSNFQKMYVYMKEGNWLYNYREDWMIERSLRGLERRAQYLQETGMAFQVFIDNKLTIGESYAEFFPELKAFAAHTMKELTKGD